MPASQTATFYDLSIAAAQAYTGSNNISTGVNKVPGHTQLVSIPRTDVSGTEMRAVDACLALLSSNEMNSTALRRGVCGGAENYQRLKALWRAAHPTA